MFYVLTEEPNQPRIEDKNTFKDWFKSLPKTVPKWASVMVLIFIGIALIGMLFSALGIKDVNIGLMGNIPYLTDVSKNAGIELVGEMIFFAMLLGGLVTLVLTCSRGIGIFLHIAKDKDAGLKLTEEIKGKIRSLKIISISISGIFSAVIILGALIVFHQFTGVNASDLGAWGQFVGLLKQSHYFGFIMGVITLAFAAWLLKFTQKTSEDLAKKIHDTIVPHKGNIDKIL